MIYIVAMKAAKVLAYDGKHWNVIIRLFGTPREKIAEGILSIYLRVFRETTELPMSGYDEYYAVSIKDTLLVRAVAKVCLDSKDRDKDVNSTIDTFARSIKDFITIVGYTKKYEEVVDILEQIRTRGTGEVLFTPTAEPEEIPF